MRWPHRAGWHIDMEAMARVAHVLPRFTALKHDGCPGHNTTCSKLPEGTDSLVPFPPSAETPSQTSCGLGEGGENASLEYRGDA